MYKTRKILSVAPASTVGTSLARNGILLILPQLGACLFVFIMALNRAPVFAEFVGILFLLHLPALMFRKARTNKLEIDSATLQVNWQPAKTFDNQLLLTSLCSLLFFSVCGALFFSMFS
jgi:hypothetical protein